MPDLPDQPVRDFILPISVVRQNQDGIEFVRFLGTGFLVGGGKFLLTAAHVLNFDENEILATMVVSEDATWRGYGFSHIEKHPTQDIAILKLQDDTLQSPLKVVEADVRSAFDYHMFGYPEDSMYELTHPETGRMHGRPDLVYYKGYVRRRISFPVFNFTGDAFYELSESAHKGCSGSPILKIRNGIWNVIGIYLGVRINNENLMLSYALRIDALKDWVPRILGRPLSQLDNST